MELDVNLQEKDLFREMIVEKGIEKIALWHDGEWSIYLTEHFQRRRAFEKPIHIIDVNEFFTEIEYSSDSVEQLIIRLEDMLNEGRKIV